MEQYLVTIKLTSNPVLSFSLESDYYGYPTVNRSFFDGKTGESSLRMMPCVSKDGYFICVNFKAEDMPQNWQEFNAQRERPLHRVSHAFEVKEIFCDKKAFDKVNHDRKSKKTEKRVKKLTKDIDKKNEIR